MLLLFFVYSIGIVFYGAVEPL